MFIVSTSRVRSEGEKKGGGGESEIADNASVEKKRGVRSGKSRKLTKMKMTNKMKIIMLQNQPPCLLAMTFILEKVFPRMADVFEKASL